MMKTIFFGFLIYLVYKIVVDFVVPVSKATSQMRDKLREMQEQQAQQQSQQAAPQQEQTRQGVDKDYIEFEEVKT